MKRYSELCVCSWLVAEHVTSLFFGRIQDTASFKFLEIVVMPSFRYNNRRSIRCVERFHVVFSSEGEYLLHRLSRASEGYVTHVVNPRSWQ